MNNLQELVDKNNHNSILQLTGDAYDRYKIVANIKLEKYKEALKMAKKNTFEFCYCLYKQKKYKNCIKIVEKLVKQNDKDEGLMYLYAQCLYHLGYYNKSAAIMCKTSKPSALVNYMAAESLSILGNSDEVFRYKAKAKDTYKHMEVNIDSSSMTKEVNDELSYNMSFRYLNEEKTYTEYLESQTDNKLCTNQLYNVNGEFDMIKDATEKQNEIVQYNKGTCDNVSLEHMQLQNYEYSAACCKKHEAKFATDNLRFLHALKLIKNKKTRNAKTVIENTKETETKKMLQYLTSKTKKNQKMIVEMLRQYK